MEVTLPVMVTMRRLVQLENAPLPMVVTGKPPMVIGIDTTLPLQL